MRRSALFTLLLALSAPPLAAQQSRHVCFGVHIVPGGGCSAFVLVEGGVRMRITPDRDRSESDVAHASPVLRSHHGVLAAGVAWP
ncbi:MAG TPA: hypothetical protein VHM30_20410, partial [Gemmatimonadaceae bacterium]|nr:hypothetical protein [Gemmatimonadaceae bacterium]